MGFHVFPCWPESKNPATSHGFKNATNNKEQIEKWWKKIPEYNIAIHTSKESGFFVLDIDKKHNGFADLAQLEKDYGPLPESWTVRTGGGGDQIYFKHPGKFVHSTRGVIAKGIDVRGDDGYAMAPPSIHPDTGKKYRWTKPPLEYPLKEAPAWLLELNEKGKENKKEEYRKRRKSRKRKRIPYGDRDNFMASEAGKLRSMGYEASRMERYLEETFEEECEPNPPPKPGYFAKLARHAEKSWNPNVNYLRTDVGNANRFKDMFTGKVLYCVPWKSWVSWGGMHWGKDKRLSIQELAKQSVEEIFKEGLKKKEAGLKEESKEHLAWYYTSQKSERLGALIKQARSAMAILPEDFDNDPWAFNVVNGTIDLKTGELKEHDPDDNLTKLAPVKYDPNAKCPLFMKFLNDIFLGRKELIEFVQKFFGYSLTGDVRERIFMIFQGDGNNGKSTLIGLIQDVMGDYTTTINPEVLMERKNASSGNATPEIAKMRGSRLVCAQENEEHKRLGAALVKRLTGGEKDTITARFLHSDEFEFRPTFKLVLGTNFLPRISANDKAAWNRIRRVPFDVTVKTDDNPKGTIPEDKSLPEKLKGELSGILAWCVRGCLLWQQEGLRQPECVSAATSSYRESEDIIGRFLNECAIIKEGEETSRSLFYKSYASWCDANNHKPLASTRFIDTLTKKGYEWKRKSQNYMWLGLTLVDDARVKENY
jgi:putative DNA primase/helicase